MAYSSIVEMAGNYSLLMRVTACAAAEGQTDALTWAQQHIWHLVSQNGWEANWDYARDNATVNNNPDLGARDDVISDGDILSAVQSHIASGL